MEKNKNEVKKTVNVEKKKKLTWENVLVNRKLIYEAKKHINISIQEDERVSIALGYVYKHNNQYASVGICNEWTYGIFNTISEDIVEISGKELFNKLVNELGFKVAPERVFKSKIFKN